jgi:PEP-CTERM motif
MSRTLAKLAISAALIGLLPAVAAAAETPFFFDTGTPDGKIATATRPDTGAPFEIESADDFVLTHSTSITSATFTGLVPAGATVGEVVVEIYRVFPKDSDIGRTSGPPTFSTTQVPTRVNSPSDVAFDTRDSTSDLSFLTRAVSNSFTAANSVTPGGIHPDPNFHTGGNGPVTGEEVQFNVTFTTPFLLPGDHYFFVPQVEVTGGDFLWLSAPKPIVPPGTPFPPGFTDLQSWTRDANLDPDWLRIGTDIVGKNADGVAPTFNAAFSLSGNTVPEPSTWAMMLLGFAGLGFAGYRHGRKARPASA